MCTHFLFHNLKSALGPLLVEAMYAARYPQCTGQPPQQKVWPQIPLMAKSSNSEV